MEAPAYAPLNAAAAPLNAPFAATVTDWQAHRVITFGLIGLLVVVAAAAILTAAFKRPPARKAR